MDNTKKIERYIESTGISPKTHTRYGMQMCDMRAILEMVRATPIDGICLAFDYGMAKGYWAAKAEVVR